MIARPTFYIFCAAVLLILTALILPSRVASSGQDVIARKAGASPSRKSGGRSRTMSRSAGSQASSEQDDSQETASYLAEMVRPDSIQAESSSKSIALLNFSKTIKQQAQERGEPEVIPMVGPVSQDRDLRDLPEIPQREGEDERRLTRHPPSSLTDQSEAADDPMPPVNPVVNAITMPAPLALFPGITSAQSGCGCTPPDTDGDVGPNHYIQAVNSRFKIIDKAGTQLVAPTTYNTFFSALGPSTPCGNNQNGGDAVVFYDHVANRWVISDFAFPAFPGTSFYQCIGVSKTVDPVSGGWWLYAIRVDPSNTNFLGDYPKFGVWSDGYYMSVNMFSNNTTFNGVRVYALPRNDMINGIGAPTPNAIAFTLSPATLGDSYSLLPATYRTGSPPPAGQPEYFMSINSSATAGTVENQVFTWRFHADFANPANSTFGVGANHTPDSTITVNNFVDAFTAAAGTMIVPQNGTTRLLDTLGDKLMYPLVYQNLGGTESIYAAHTINNNQGGTGPTAIRWYQFNVTGNTIPATPTQQQTFNNSADGLWRFMPSINVDGQGNLSIAYSVSSSTTEPSIAYVGRLTSDTPSTLAQGEATLQAGGGHQTGSGMRWGDYSATFIDPKDGCTFWHTNEYYSASSAGSWNTRIGNYKFTQCTPFCIPVPHVKSSDFESDSKGDVAVWRGATTHNWVVLRSSDDTIQIQPDWGNAALGDIPVPGYYDADSKTDYAVWRPSEGNWYIVRSTNGTVLLQQWGASGDIPVPGDYDGDNRTDFAVYRPSEGNWYVLKSTGGVIVQGWGSSTDKPVVGDFDNDGKTDFAVYRPSEGNWYVKKSAGGFAIQNWGTGGDKLVPADYDGDGKTDFAIFRPSEGNWYIINSCSGTVTIKGWGAGSDVTVPADYDGDNKADIAVWRPDEGNWYILQSSTNTMAIRNLGLPSDTPVPSAYLPQ